MDSIRHQITGSIVSTVDARGLLCPEPVMMLHNAVRDASVGEIIEVAATDPSTRRDITRFCEFLGHDLLKTHLECEVLYFWVKKGQSV